MAILRQIPYSTRCSRLTLSGNIPNNIGEGQLDFKNCGQSYDKKKPVVAVEGSGGVLWSGEASSTFEDQTRQKEMINL